MQPDAYLATKISLVELLTGANIAVNHDIKQINALGHYASHHVTAALEKAGVISPPADGHRDVMIPNLARARAAARDWFVTSLTADEEGDQS